MFRGIGLIEILLIAAVILLIFGGRKLPEFARGLGEAIKELRKAFNGKNDKE
ncbi:preprotein translocase [Candidatus Daviesbacteria bacterium RIFCSPHIGHO2_01_FULL_40_11]|uniref:Sec-independent protein translocase protein TatA n=1 Tax=Candidatus Daviesbacteria bacterium RIFCSPHIGHO2_01_FULL_40_11 TaxID=1797762 RepID=A0A1F5JJS0_9BACT|nr:MAG: preprotein translocase [Candidatus Daviesbacteria bacterium RIFCSPHIGHO2_01_FULL_40_11]